MRPRVRQFFAILAVALLVTAAGCSMISQENTTPTPEENPADTPTPKSTPDQGTEKNQSEETDGDDPDENKTPDNSSNPPDNSEGSDGGGENKTPGNTSNPPDSSEGSDGGGENKTPDNPTNPPGSSEGSDGNNDSNQTQDPDDSSTKAVKVSATRQGPNTVTIDGDVTAGETLVATGISTDVGNRTGININTINVTMSETQSVSLTVNQSTGVSNDSLTLAGKSPIRLETYFSVDHPSLADEAIEHAEFEFSVQKDQLNSNISEFTVYRQVSGAWTPIPVTVIDETDHAYTLRAQSPGLSKFAAVADGGDTQDALLANQVIGTSYDTFTNGSLNATQYEQRALDHANLSAYFINQALSEMCSACGAVSKGDVPLEIQMYRIIQSNGTTEEKLGKAREVSKDELDDTTRRAIKGEISAEKYLNQTFTLTNKEKEELTAELRTKSEDELSSRTRFGSSATTAVSMSIVLLYASGAGFAGQGMADAYAIGYHLDNPGYTQAEYERLHQNLHELDTNSEALANTDDANRRAKLLKERQELVNETYRQLPQYLDAVHDSIIDNTAGREDLNAYKRIRFNVELLRVSLIEDYEATNRMLEIHEGTSSELEAAKANPPQSMTPMPTHGWTVVYSLSDELADQGVRDMLRNGPELSLSYNLNSDISSHYQTDIFGRSLDDDQFGQSEVYDTMDTPTDYAVYRIDLPETSTPQKLTVSISRPNGAEEYSGNFEARLSATPPTAPRDPSGDLLPRTNGDPNQSIQQLETTASESTYYLTVNASDSIGSYHLFASTNESGVSVEPMGRAGPDIQRPNVALRAAPEEKQIDSESIYVSRDESVSLGWHAWDIKTESNDLEYRYRIANQSGVHAWSSWTETGPTGNIGLTETLSSGYHSVQLVVRDEAGYRTEEVITVKTDVTDPRIDLSISDDGAAPRVSVTANERLDALRFEYAILNDSVSATGTTVSEWTHWQTTETAGTVHFPHVNESSHIKVRARGTDLAGWNSTWATGTIPPKTTERIYTNLTETTATTGNVTSNRVAVSNNGSGSTNVSEEAIVAIQSPFNNSIESVGTEGEIIDGELVLDLYVSSRNLERIRLKSIELTEDDKINLTEIVPPEYAADTRIELVFRGEGTAKITNVKTTTGPSDITIDVSPDTPIVGDQTTVSTNVPEKMAVDIESYEWDVTGDGKANAAGPLAEFAFDTHGLQKINLTVTDNLNRTTTVTKTVTVNRPPTVDFHTGTQHPTTHEQITLIGSAMDQDGSIERYEWDLDADGTVDHTGRVVKTSFSNDGPHDIELTVTDDEGAQETHTKAVTVRNQEPTVDIHLPGEVLDNDSITFTARAADLDGEIAEYEWAVDGGSFVVSDNLYRPANLSEGLHTIALRVTDDDGAQNTTTTQFTIGVSPEVSVEAPDTAVTQSEVQLDASASTDTDGTIESISWDLDDDGRFDDATGPRVNTTFSDDGTYRIRTRITDDDGLTEIGSTEITVQNRPPSPRVDIEEWIVLAGANVTVNAGESADPDGDIVAYEWNIGDNTTRDTGKSSVLQFESPGTADLSLAVTDDDGATTTTTYSIGVLEDADTTVRSRNDSDLPGNEITLEYIFENEENASLQSVALDLGELPDGWSIARVDSPDGGEWNQTTTELTTDLSESTTQNTDRSTLRITVQTPVNAAIGNYTVPVAMRVGGVTIAEQSATATLQEPLITMDSEGDTDASGNLVQLRYRIENQEDAHIENVSLGPASLPEGWSIEDVRTPDRGRWNSSTERVTGSLYSFDEGHGSYDDDDEMTLQITLRIAPNTSTGTYDVPAVAQVGSEVVQTDSAPVTVKIPATQTTVQNDTDAPGNIVELRYALENQEDTTIENVSISLDEIPNNWEINRVSTYGEGTWNQSTQTARGDLRSYYRSDNLDIRVELQVPANESLGNYTIPMTARVADHVVTKRNATADIKIPDTTTTVQNDTDAPGNIVELRYALENQEDATIENASISLGNLPDGWEIDQVSTYGEGTWNESTRAVRGDLRSYYRSDNLDIRIRLQVPENESLGSYSIPITARVADHVVTKRNATADIKIPDTTTTVQNDTDAPGNIIELRYALENQEDATIENASISLGEIPNNWEINQVSTYGEGTWNESTRTVRGDLRSYYRSNDLDIRVELQVPENESLGNYTIPMTARVADQIVAERNATADIKIPDTTTTVQNDTDAPGNVVELRYTLGNQEDATIENASISLGNLPDDWEIDRVHTYGEGTWNESTRTVRGNLRNHYRSDELDVRIDVRVPENESPSNYSISMTARVADHIVAERNAMADVRIPDTTTTVQNDTDAPGNTVELRYALESQEDATIENASISLGDLPDGWEIDQISTYGEGTWNGSTRTVRGDLRSHYRSDNLDIRVQLRVPNNESPDSYSIPMTARVADHIVTERNATADIKIPDTTTTVQNDTDAPGNVVELRYALENQEDATIENASIRLDEIPDGWEINRVSTYGEGTWNESMRTVRGDLRSHYRSNNLDIRVELQVPANESLGNYSIPMTARVADHIVAERNATANIKIPDITTTAQNDTVSPGNVVELRYALENQEDATIENASISLGELPDGWVLNQVSTYGEGTWDESTQTIRGNLRSHYQSDSIDIRIEVQVPETEATGNYTVPMTARVAHHVIDEQNSTVTVPK